MKNATRNRGGHSANNGISAGKTAPAVRPQAPDTAKSSVETRLGPARDSTREPKPSREAIERRAYALYEARRGQGGSATEDWLRAERELSTESQSD